MPDKNEVRPGGPNPGKPTTPLGSPMPKLIDNRYEVLKLLGRGRYGIVYHVWDRTASCHKALKQMDISEKSWEKRKKRFKREVNALERCHSPNIIRVHEIREDKGYFTMDFIDGITLEDWLRARPVLKISEAVTIVRTVALALDEAHRQAIVHRDIKPQNILVDKQGKLYLTDFGLAFIRDDEPATIKGELLGTPNFMSPEQAKSDRGITNKADIWALGVLLFHLITGEYPFTGQNRRELYDQIARGKRSGMGEYRDDVGQDLEIICSQALEKKSCDRYQTAAEMALDLACVLEQKPLPHSINLRKLKRRLSIVGMVTAGVLAVLALLLFLWSKL